MKLKWLLVPMVGSLLAGCSAIKREPPPPDALTMAELPGMPGCRVWGDTPPPNEAERQDKLVLKVKASPDFDPADDMHLLAISGGAQEGAFGAGLLNGWTARGDRPTFQVVTGISSGAMLAPFAFLGPDYDFALKELFSKYDSKDVIDTRYFSVLFRGASLSSDKMLRNIVMSYFTPVEMEKVAVEHNKGRKLFVGSTHLDSIRPIHWDLGAMAASGHPDAYNRIIDAIMASSAFPGVFPPVLVEVEQDGKMYQEMHVDGGLTSQVFAYAIDTDVRGTLDKLGMTGDAYIYLLRNAVIVPEAKEVEPKTFSILRQTAFAFVNTVATMDMHYIYKDAMENDLNFQLAYIPPDFREPEELYDPAYMDDMYQYAYELAVKGYPWESKPLEFNAGE